MTAPFQPARSEAAFRFPTTQFRDATLQSPTDSMVRDWRKEENENMWNKITGTGPKEGNWEDVGGGFEEWFRREVRKEGREERGGRGLRCRSDQAGIRGRERIRRRKTLKH